MKRLCHEWIFLGTVSFILFDFTVFIDIYNTLSKGLPMTTT